MAEKIKWRRSFIFLVAVVIGACSQVKTRDDIEERDDFALPKSAQPAVPLRGGEVAEPPAEESKVKKVAVILGPGGYKAFAYAGVLKEFAKHNIPIHGIVGFEWGALVAALYAQRGQVNEVEWKLYKLEKLNLDSSGFFGRSKGEAHQMKELDDFLNANLDLKDAERSTVPFFCPSLSMAQGVLSWQSKGPLAKAVANCMAYPPLFAPNGPFVAGQFAYSEVISALKQQKYNVIVLVDALGDGILFDKSTKDDYASAVLWNEIRRALWQAKSHVTDVVDVNTRGMGIGDFATRKLLVTAGEAAGEKAAKQLVSRYGF